MSFKLMRFQVHLRVKYDKLLVLALLVHAREMVAIEVLLKGIIIEEVLWIVATGPPIT